VKPSVARLLTRLYPRRWRERYGAEFEALLETSGGGWRSAANVVGSALRERILPRGGNPMESFTTMMKRPSAFIPVAMSLTALAVLLGSIAIFGVVHETDEGATAHIWQILMAGQMPVLAFFAIKWLPRAPKPTLCVLSLQVVAALASMAPVFFLGL
jgi:hypothetical protein